MARCAMCGRKLKSYDSIIRGIGPECAKGKSKTNKDWKRRVINSAKIKNGSSFTIGQKEKITITTENFESMKHWLIKYKYILKDGEVSDNILDDVFINLDNFFGECNGDKEREE